MPAGSFKPFSALVKAGKNFAGLEAANLRAKPHIAPVSLAALVRYSSVKPNPSITSHAGIITQQEQAKQRQLLNKKLYDARSTDLASLKDNNPKRYNDVSKALASLLARDPVLYPEYVKACIYGEVNADKSMCFLPLELGKKLDRLGIGGPLVAWVSEHTGLKVCHTHPKTASLVEALVGPTPHYDLLTPVAELAAGRNGKA